jgi:hypothetical protein
MTGDCKDDPAGRKNRPALRLGQWVRLPFQPEPWMIVDIDDDCLTLAQRNGKEISIGKPRYWTLRRNE